MNEKLVCYLKPEAKRALDGFKAMGLDEDLAFSLIESLVGEDIYDLPAEEDTVEELVK